MDILLSICALILAILGIAGCIVPVLPGTILSYGGLLCSYFASHSQMSTTALWIWLAVCIVVSIADYFLPAWMTKRFGGSRAGSIGATIGIFVGFFAGPVGIILGPFVGAVIGELVNDRNDFAKALVVGCGSFLSFFVGTGIKLIVAVGILVHVVADIWPALWNWLTNLF